MVVLLTHLYLLNSPVDGRHLYSVSNLNKERNTSTHLLHLTMTDAPAKCYLFWVFLWGLVFYTIFVHVEV